MVSDIVLLQDLTGSYGDDLPKLKIKIPTVVNRLTNPNLKVVFGEDLQFGISSFKDKALSPLGDPSDYVYQSELALTKDVPLVKAKVESFVASGGADGPEAQLEALMHAAFDSDGGLNYRPGSERLVLLATDAPFHVAGHAAAIDGTYLPNNGDGVIDPKEDYPDITKVKDALDLSPGVTPIFLVTEANKSTYDSLVSDLGRGVVVTLDSDSANIADAIKFGIAKARGVITYEGTDADDFIWTGSGSNEIIFAGHGDDIVAPNSGNDYIDGGAGFDFLYGGIGADTVDGSGSNDQLAGGDGNDILLGGFGHDQLTGGNGNDILQGDSGDDLLTGGAGADTFVFDTGAEFGVLTLGIDNITDFEVGIDKIELSKDTFTEIAGSSIVALGSSDTSPEAIVYDSSTGDLFYNQNGISPGYGSGGQFAKLSSTPPPILSPSDFEVVDV